MCCWLETKFKNKLSIHPERMDDPNYCRLIALVFYPDGNQSMFPEVYGEFSHRAISLAFHAIWICINSCMCCEIACYLSRNGSAILCR